MKFKLAISQRDAEIEDFENGIWRSVVKLQT